MSVTEAQDVELSRAEKIAKLLRKAEVTDNEHEREAFVSKAQELQTAWAISEAMLARARGENLKEKEELLKITMEFKGSYAVPKRDIATTIARANGCEIVWSKYGSTEIAYIMGFESDVKHVEFMNSSLQVQAATALSRWWKDFAPKYPWMSAGDKFKSRRDFLFGFNSGVDGQLYKAQQEARKAAAAEEAKRANVDTKSASDSVDLALKDKATQVKEFKDQSFGRLRRGRPRNYSGGVGGRAAGYQAGSTADVGRKGIASGGKAALNG